MKSELSRCESEKHEVKEELEKEKETSCVWKEEAKERGKEAARLKRRVRRFGGGFRCNRRRSTQFLSCRVDGRISHAVEKAVDAAEAERASSNVLRIKDEHGVIKDEIREVIADLVGTEDVSAKSSFQIFKKCATLAGKEVVGSWDRRSVSRVMHETREAAEVMIVERLLESIGASLMNQLHDKRTALTSFFRVNSEWRWRFTQQHTVLLPACHNCSCRHRPPPTGFIPGGPPRTQPHHCHPV